jgi:3-oxoadipate enol-lactonase
MMTSGIIKTGDGCAISWRMDGPEDAPVLLMSNSLGTALAMWDGQIEALSQTHRVLRYDKRGHGKSDVPPGAYSLDRLGRDVLELVDALGIARFDFCGLSLGGMTGQWLAVRAPDRIDRLVLCNTSAYMGPPEGWDLRIRTVMAGGMEAMVQPVLERWFTPEFREGSPTRIAPVHDMLLATHPAGYAGACAAIRDMDLRPTGPLIKTPTLIIAGERDPATPPSHSEAMAAAISGSRLVRLDAAHLSNIEQPELFLAAVQGFLA